MKNILYTIILLLLSTNILADVAQGEMFGLKLGERYIVLDWFWTDSGFPAP